MKTDHFLFIVLLSAMLISPKLSLPFAGLADKSGLSMGIFGLALYVIARPGYLLRRKGWRYSFPVKWLLIFSGYALLISLVTLNPVLVAYAGQYLVYIWFSAFILGAYLRKAARMEQLHVVYKIIAWIGLVYALAVLVSLRTGPLYSHHAMDYGRLWGGVYIQQGVGFSDGPNGAASILIVLCSFFMFKYRFLDRRAWIFSLAAVLALLATISRSAILSFLIGIAAWLVVEGVRIFVHKKTLSRSAVFSFRSAGFVVLILSFLALVLLLNNSENFQAVLNSIARGFGINDEFGTFGTDVSIRTALWDQGLALWSGGSVFERFFGLGFRGSFSLADGVAWITPHNAYIAMLGDFGLIGTFFFIAAVFWGALKMAVKYVKHSWREEERAAFVALAGLIAHNMTEVFFYSPILMSMLVLMLTLGSFLDPPRNAAQEPYAGRLNPGSGL